MSSINDGHGIMIIIDYRNDNWNSQINDFIPMKQRRTAVTVSVNVAAVDNYRPSPMMIKASLKTGVAYK